MWLEIADSKSINENVKKKHTNAKKKSMAIWSTHQRTPNSTLLGIQYNSDLIDEYIDVCKAKNQNPIWEC